MGRLTPSGSRVPPQLLSLTALTIAVGAVLVVPGCGGGVTAPASQPGAMTAVSPAPAATRSLSIEIPAIHVESTLIPTGTSRSGEVEVPPVTQPKQAGYWAGAPAPGEPGPALVVGHVNGPNAQGIPGGTPGVFAKLTQLKDGDEVLVTRPGASALRFVVYRRLQVHKTAFPWAQVLDDVTRPELRLVTCTGALDRKAHSFVDNLIVFARLAS